MIVFALRHVKTQKFMPNMKKDKGYSHWNPGKPDKESINHKGDIRLFPTERAARNAHTMWYKQPNLTQHFHQSHLGDYVEDMMPEDDGRKFEDLEIVVFSLTELTGTEKDAQIQRR